MISGATSKRRSMLKSGAELVFLFGLMSDADSKGKIPHFSTK
jgi:hypothetical protein